MGAEIFIIALGFMLIFEGLMPLLFPKKWQEMLQEISRMDVELIRKFAAFVILLGLLIVWFVH